MKIVDKYWGREIWLVNCDKYCGKILELNPGYVSSYHHHKIKQETFYCLEGSFTLILDSKEIQVSQGMEPITVMPGQYHSFGTQTPTRILEISTKHDDIDVYRRTLSHAYSAESPFYKLDIGCGKHKKAGFWGLDIQPLESVDYVLDLSTAYLPFPDNEVNEVYSCHFLEHLDIDAIIRLLGEIYRVCKNGAKVEIRVPHFSGFTNFYEYHKTSFRYNSFREFTNAGGMFQSEAKFRLVYRKIHLVNRQNKKLERNTRFYFWNYLLEPLINRIPVFYELTGLRNLFPAWELQFVFEVIK
mgnify:CR=1 FL=1